MSKECLWNKGKKCDKNLCCLLDVFYLSKLRKRVVLVINFDLRLFDYWRVFLEYINCFVIVLQLFFQDSDGQSILMWEMQFKIIYKDYDFVDFFILCDKVNKLCDNLILSKFMEIFGI